MELKLVNFEQAKDLKELGFPQNINTDKWYSGARVLYTNKPLNYLPVSFVAPSLQLASKWLRDNKNIYIQVDIEGPDEKPYKGYGFYAYLWINYKNSNCSYGYYTNMFTEYDDALSNGLDKAIELLKNNEYIQEQ